MDEQQYHINYLESKDVLLGLKSLCSGMQNKHICIQSDNTTTVAYLNAMGGIKSLNCNDMTIQIWEWCSQRNIWISASHIPGSTNIEADKESRKINDSTEWSGALFKNTYSPPGLILRSQFMYHGDQTLAQCLLMPFS